MDVVRAAEDGLVYVSVASGTKAVTSQTPNPSGKGNQNGNQGNQGNSQNDQTDPFAGTPFQGMPFNFGQGGPSLPQGPQRGTGSGFFVNSKGDILTNYHVVDGADTITIRVHNHPETYTAKVIGTAPDYDLALIRADGLPKNLIKPIPLGNSRDLEPGLKAIALGAPFDLDFSVTEGIISATARKIPVGMRGVNQAVIQTDAAINPGNSGGPLLDSAGQVIGINTQILTGGSDQNAGVGFAIPINMAKAILPRLEAGSKITTPVLGLRYADLSSLDPAALKELHLPSSGRVGGRRRTRQPRRESGPQGGQPANYLARRHAPESGRRRDHRAWTVRPSTKPTPCSPPSSARRWATPSSCKSSAATRRWTLSVKLSEFQPQAASQN